jgi:hypothetical protein
MLGCWNTLPVAVRGVLFIVLHLSRAVGDPDREQAAAIGIHEDETIPASEHELPKDNIRTRPDYRGEGHWATPSPDSGIELGFIPMKLYAQVRNNSYFLCTSMSIKLLVFSVYRYVTIRVLFAQKSDGFVYCMRRCATVRVLCAQLCSRSCIIHRYVRIRVLCIGMSRFVYCMHSHAAVRVLCIGTLRIRVLMHTSKFVTIRVLCHDSCRGTQSFFIEAHKLWNSRKAVIL